MPPGVVKITNDGEAGRHIKRSWRKGSRRRGSGLSRDELVALAQSQRGRWWHSIDFGQGVVTQGGKSAEVLERELAALELPPLKGKTVLDIGAWDGYFSFAAERLGASRVVAIDHFMWSIDIDKQHAYRGECERRGVPPKPYDEVPEVWRPDTLPGKRGFDAAHRALGSRVESVVADFMTTDLTELGQFDVVLYLGVLYHMKNPVEAMERVARVTREFVFIETEAVVIPGYEHVPLWEFFSSNELNTDPTNWWAPNIRALAGLVHAAGFGKVDTTEDLAQHAVMEPGHSHRYRTVVRASK